MTHFRPPLRDDATREFHVSCAVRDACDLPDTLFASTGNVVFADFRAAREFAYRLNRTRDLARFPERAVSASRIYALGLIDEVLHLILARYRTDHAPRLWAVLRQKLTRELGETELEGLLRAFVDEFPPAAVYRGELGAGDYLDGATDGAPHAEVVLEEILLLWLANRNPAFAEFRELFDDALLRDGTAYEQTMAVVENALGGLAAGEAGGESLLDLLYAPQRAAPDSLEGQLAYIRERWANLLGPDLFRVLGALDFLTEEGRVVFPVGPGPVEPPDYTGFDWNVENYSPDRDWMPRVVLLAKNAHVWLSQLSRAGGREIQTLDGIPEEELARLARWGFTGLWLIGVWERSRASERIKRRMGDHEAVASAYSLDDYRIAEALGGEAAFESLRARAWRHGIRLSTDMVPNHFGVDSRWVVEHPQRFLGVDRSPYPSYTFDGPDLCDDERIGIYIEDGYWRRSDAAVVFKRIDHHTGDERYIYHGNDGTSMPWNDTAQLDYTKPEVREAVIQTILAVARRSPIIRFDAAMTLARQHYHRLWFPEPGAAGAVPSRAEFGMSQSEFDAVMPREFWREVVDRVAAEAPDTLLLAEAFWLLEGYFVRTLGMHRVYNSAFMNMLRDERNAEYRQLIRSTLEFDPEILKRYVNFMSNPDELTAVEQFGTGDKYMGVASLMATMPGLPMFAHGQIEGLGEKYGMEFKSPRREESPNRDLIRRHEKQLFPLLRRRRVFAEVENFLLYDLETDDGSVDENVFAYSNEADGERSLVIYHNRYGETRGWLRRSTAVARRAGSGERELRRFSLAEGLGLSANPNSWLVLRDSVAGLEYLRASSELCNNGLWVELDAYRLHCFVRLREVVEDADHPWGKLASDLAGAGVASIEEAMAVLRLAPVLEPLRALLAPASLHALASCESRSAAVVGFGSQACRDVHELVLAAAECEPEGPAVASVERGILSDLEAQLAVASLVTTDANDAGSARSGGRIEPDGVFALLGEARGWAGLLSWIVARRLGDLVTDPSGLAARELYREWHLGVAISEAMEDLGVPDWMATRAVAAVEMILAAEPWLASLGAAEDAWGELLSRLFDDPVGRRFLDVNRYQEVLWFNREAFNELIGWLVTAAAVRAVAEAEQARARIQRLTEIADRLVVAADTAGYRVDALMAALQGRDAR